VVERMKDVDKMFQIIIKLLAALMLLGGVILIYDARIITKRFFGFGDQNEASSGLKILGFVITIIAGIIIYFNI
jgi:ABC-type nickel/cobalt efflux system permease component RcnA